MAERKSAPSRKVSSAKPKAAAKKAPKAAASKSSSSKASAPKKKPPAPNMQERMEGMQGWMAEIEKKQERTSRFGGVAVVLAILAAGGALALGVINKQDAATTEDVDELTSKVNELGTSVEEQTEKQLKGINTRISGLELQIDALTKQQRETEAQINTLQSNSAAAAAAAPDPAEPAKPDSKP